MYAYVLCNQNELCRGKEATEAHALTRTNAHTQSTISNRVRKPTIINNKNEERKEEEKKKNNTQNANTLSLHGWLPAWLIGWLAVYDVFVVATIAVAAVAVVILFSFVLICVYQRMNIYMCMRTHNLNQCLNFGHTHTWNEIQNGCIFSFPLPLYTSIYLLQILFIAFSLSASMCVCVCVWVCENICIGESYKNIICVCVCVCVCLRMRIGGTLNFEYLKCCLIFIRLKSTRNRRETEYEHGAYDDRPTNQPLESDVSVYRKINDSEWESSRDKKRSAIHLPSQCSKI